MFSQKVCLNVLGIFLLVQRDISGAGDLTLASEYGGNYFFT